MGAGLLCLGMEKIEIQCVHCHSAIVFKDFAPADPAEPPQSFVNGIIGQLGWRKSLYGWGCPKNHGADIVAPPTLA